MLCTRCGKEDAIVGMRRCEWCRLYMNERQRVQRKRREHEERCLCGRPRATGFASCQTCLDALQAATAELHARRVRERSCVLCGKRSPAVGLRSCSACIARALRY